MALKYTLTLSTVVEPGKKLAATHWTLTERDGTAIIASAACPDDVHGDHARVDGRAAAHKHAVGRGLRVVNADIRVIYARPVPPPAPPAPPLPTA